MNDYAQLFRSVAKDLANKGVDAQFSYDAPRDEASMKMKMPESLSEFYTKFSDGFVFQWEVNEDLWGCFSVPKVSELTEATRSWNRNIRDFADDSESMNRCVAPEYRPRAFEIWREMKSWIPIGQESNGDQFCVRQDGSVVYHQHDWFDGFGEIAMTNGLLAGTSLFEFARNWSRFCFMPPKNYWWGSLAKDGQLDWNQKHFSSAFS